MTRPAAPVRAIQALLLREACQLGYAGGGGIALVVVAAAVSASAWMERRAVVDQLALLRVPLSATSGGAALARAPLPVPSAPGTAPRPASEDVPRMLTLMQAIAVENGLAWSAADYRLVAGDERNPASMEVRTQLNGPYPKLRGLLAQVLHRVPAVTLRQLAFTRSGSDSADVEMKVVFAILLRDDMTARESGSSSSGERARANGDREGLATP